jgi:hypothetical protein
VKPPSDTLLRMCQYSTWKDLVEKHPLKFIPLIYSFYSNFGIRTPKAIDYIILILLIDPLFANKRYNPQDILLVNKMRTPGSNPCI